MKRKYLEEIVSVDSLIIYGPASIRDVEKLSQLFDGKLPSDFSDFLREVGCCSIGSEEVIGLGGPKHLSALMLCEHLRKSDLKFPSSGIPIRSDGFGNYDYIETVAGFSVRFWRRGGSSEFVADNFDTWLVNLVLEASLF